MGEPPEPGWSLAVPAAERLAYRTNPLTKRSNPEQLSPIDDAAGASFTSGGRVMRRIIVGGLFVVGLGFAVHALPGCGSDNGDIPADADASADATGDGANGGLGGPQLPAGATCASGADCASGSCNATSKVCEAGAIACVASRGACATGNQCCTFSCVGSACSTQQCTPDKAACATDAECCGGKCDNQTCTPLSATCKTSGNPCGQSSDCCSNLCQNGFCSVAASFCTQNGDACANDSDCCGGKCTKAAGAALGLCSVVDAPGAGGCTPAGQACSAATTGGTLPTCGGTCCSKSCRPYAPTGLLICEPPSGCHPTGELCQTDNDCCGAPGSAGSTKLEGGSGQPTNVHCSKATGATVGRCDQGQACSPAGSICRLATTSCDATDRCCSGTVQTHPLDCKQDSLGIPRCTVVDNYDCAASGPPPAGTACATSADCCNHPCVPNPSGSPPFVCAAAACISAGGACTTTADCCAGSPCEVPPGATKGTCGVSAVGGTGGDGGSSGADGGAPSPGSTSCAQYGQQCAQSSDCCDAVPCSSGFCVFPGPN